MSMEDHVDPSAKQMPNREYESKLNYHSIDMPRNVSLDEFG